MYSVFKSVTNTVIQYSVIMQFTVVFKYSVFMYSFVTLNTAARSVLLSPAYSSSQKGWQRTGKGQRSKGRHK